MKKELNVLYQFDDKYAPYAGISMYSLFENNQNIESLNVYCAAMDVSDENFQLLIENAEKYNRKIVFLDTEKAIEQIKAFNVKEWNGSLATWMKIFVIEDLIGKIDSLLYIDCDTLVLGNLVELCNFDFGNKAMAAVVDAIGFEHLRRLEITENKYYFNAGIMFFNLKYFQEHGNFYEKMLEHLRKNIYRYPVNDQDLLNDYFKQNIKKMNLEYNFQGIHYIYNDGAYLKVYGKYDYYTKEEIAHAHDEVKILHFLRALGNYPWEKDNIHPLRNLFEEWKEKSLWKDVPPVNKKKTMFFKIEIILYKCLPNFIFLKLFKFMKANYGKNK